MRKESIGVNNPWYYAWQPVFLVLLYGGLLAVFMLLPGTTLIERLHWLDSGICSQLATHSFYPGGQSLPLCARNTGIYLGFMVTFITLHITGRGRMQQLPRWPIIAVLIAGVAALVIDGLNSFFLDLGLQHLYQPHNLLRLATGLVTGLALASFSLPLINGLLWSEDRHNSEGRIPAYTWTTLLLLVPGLILSFFAVASQSSLVLYPAALLSTIGLITVISTINLIVTVCVSKHDQTFKHYSELLPFFSIAFTLAIVEMLALAQLKFSLLQVLL